MEKLYLNNFRHLKISDDTFKMLIESHPKLKLLGSEKVAHKVADENLYKIISEDKCKFLLDGSKWRMLKKYETYQFPSNNFISEELASRHHSVGQLMDKASSDMDDSSSEEDSSFDEASSEDE